jgi:hypothetical protein
MDGVVDPRALVRELERRNLLGPADIRPALPMDLVAEHDLLAAMIAGCTNAADLDGLESQHFASRDNAGVFALAESMVREGRRPTPMDLVNAAVDAGRDGGRFVDFVHDLDQSAVVGPALPLVQRIVRLWQLRELLGRLAEIDAAVRVGALTRDMDILDRLRTAARPFAPRSSAPS